MVGVLSFSSYCYSADNRLEFVRSGPNCTGNASPAVIALGYDPQGNLQYKNGTAYTFDYGNRLRSTANQNYRYDAAGRRVRTDSAGSQLQYSDYASDGRLVWQRDEAAGKRINNIYLAGSLVAEVSRSLTTDAATYRYVHTDALGSPIAKTSSTGVVVETSEYEPYGALLNRANDDRVGYTGHVMDAASGLIYMQQRYYDPEIGRFLSVDPVTADSATGGNFNRYWYASSSPYRFTDPDGRLADGGVFREPGESWDEYRERQQFGSCGHSNPVCLNEGGDGKSRNTPRSPNSSPRKESPFGEMNRRLRKDTIKRVYRARVS